MLNIEKTNVFVYGTLKPGERNYLRYCAGKTIRETQAYVKGQLYHLSLGYPALTEGDKKIEGYLLTFANNSILTSLDELEDYHPDRSPELNEYYRQQVLVYNLADDFLEKAWIYLMNLAKIEKLQGTLLNSRYWSSNL
ncbi:MAG: gamma-glutamylcyclotransferase [Xenococcaceae cyanobacterium MO_188.B29]|nr:gamma-glutamylcyclotransferase [Xenococcaceae cyanobacterium MO_188.B29]